MEEEEAPEYQPDEDGDVFADWLGDDDYQWDGVSAWAE